MLPSSSCTCVFLCKLWTLSYVTWRILHSEAFPQFITSPFFVIYYTKLLSGFAICHPGQRWVPLLVLYIYIYKSLTRLNKYNTKWSMYLLIMLDTLLLRNLQHFTTLHPTTLHYTCRHFTSSHLNFNQLHFTTFSFGLTPFKFPTAPFHPTSLHFISLHFTSLHFTSLNFTSLHLYMIFFTLLFLSFQPVYNCFPNSVSKNHMFTTESPNSSSGI